MYSRIIDGRRLGFVGCGKFQDTSRCSLFNLKHSILNGALLGWYCSNKTHALIKRLLLYARVVIS